MLTDHAEALNTPGRGWRSGVLDVAGKGNVAVSSNICFDREHPESARSAMLTGAEVRKHSDTPD